MQGSAHIHLTQTQATVASFQAKAQHSHKASPISLPPSGRAQKPAASAQVLRPDLAPVEGDGRLQAVVWNAEGLCQAQRRPAAVR